MASVSCLFSRISASPPKKSRPELSAFLSNFTFSNPFSRQFSAYRKDQKMAEKWILASLGKWGKMTRKMGKIMARKVGKMARIPFSSPLLARKWLKNAILGHCSHFPGYSFFPHGEALAVFVTISGRSPEMDLYEVHVIASLKVNFRTEKTASSRVHAKGVVLCERVCFCAFYETLPSKNPSN